MKDPKYLHDVSTLKVDSGLCTGCGMCLEVCPHDVFRIENKKSVIRDLNACMECGACAQNCPFGAISLKPGMGCAAAIISGWLHKKAPTCGCSDSTGGCSESKGCC